jgi:hypothetical protein
MLPKNIQKPHVVLNLGGWIYDPFQNNDFMFCSTNEVKLWNIGDLKDVDNHNTICKHLFANLHYRNEITHKDIP